MEVWFRSNVPFVKKPRFIGLTGFHRTGSKWVKNPNGKSIDPKSLPASGIIQWRLGESRFCYTKSVLKEPVV